MHQDAHPGSKSGNRGQENKKINGNNFRHLSGTEAGTAPKPLPTRRYYYWNAGEFEVRESGFSMIENDLLRGVHVSCRGDCEHHRNCCRRRELIFVDAHIHYHTRIACSIV